MTRNLALSKHMSAVAVTFVDFSLQCESELEDWYRTKSMLNWDRLKRCSASESSNPKSEPETAKTPFFLKSHSKKKISWRVTRISFFRVFWHFEETTNFIIVLVDTKLTLDWFAPAPSWWLVVPFKLARHWQNVLCIIVIIVSGY